MALSLEKQIANWIQVQRLGAGASNELQRISDSTFRQIQRILLKLGGTIKSKIAEVKAVFEAANPAAKAAMVRDLTEVGNYVQDAKIATMIEAGAIAEGAITPILIDKKFVTKVLSQKTAGFSVNEALNTLNVKSRRSVINIIVESYAGDLSNDTIRSKLADVSTLSKRTLNAVARTATNSVSNESYSALFGGSPSIDRMKIVATLDSRTSDICMQLDGTIYRLKNARLPPYHINCRSTFVPIFKGESISAAEERLTPRIAVTSRSKEEFDAKGGATKDGKIRRPQLDTTKNKTSPFKHSQTRANNYEDWLRIQPEYYQEHILGKNATEIFRDGRALKTVLSSRSSATTVKFLKSTALN